MTQSPQFSYTFITMFQKELLLRYCWVKHLYFALTQELSCKIIGPKTTSCSFHTHTVIRKSNTASFSGNLTRVKKEDDTNHYILWVFLKHWFLTHNFSKRSFFVYNFAHFPSKLWLWTWSTVSLAMKVCKLPIISLTTSKRWLKYFSRCFCWHNRWTSSFESVLRRSVLWWKKCKPSVCCNKNIFLRIYAIPFSFSKNLTAVWK